MVAFTLTAALALVCGELAFGWFRQWLAARPDTVAVAVGLIFLVLTVFLVERWLALNESERWRKPCPGSEPNGVRRQGSALVCCRR